MLIEGATFKFSSLQVCGSAASLSLSQVQLQVQVN